MDGYLEQQDALDLTVKKHRSFYDTPRPDAEDESKICKRFDKSSERLEEKMRERYSMWAAHPEKTMKHISHHETQEFSRHFGVNEKITYPVTKHWLAVPRSLSHTMPSRIELQHTGPLLSDVSEVNALTEGRRNTDAFETDRLSSHEIVRTVNGVSVRLLDEELWNAFGALETEMIVNRGGRRMFPYINVTMEGLKPDETYLVAMEIVEADDRRYKYVDEQWIAMGPADAKPDRNVYVHPYSPASGTRWANNFVSFSKVRLTNNKEAKEAILLHSMQKYKVALKIIETDKNLIEDRVMRFDFPETTFLAVTAYQNKAITRLKIQNNPFAKAFRVMRSLTDDESMRRKLGKRTKNSSDAGCDHRTKKPHESVYNMPHESVYNMPHESAYNMQDILMHKQTCIRKGSPLAVPSPRRSQNFNGPASLYMPWLSHMRYNLPLLMSRWYADRDSTPPGFKVEFQKTQQGKKHKCLTTWPGTNTG